MPVAKTCEQCGDGFAVEAYRADAARFCSSRCFGLSKRTVPAVPCDWCGASFRPRDDGRRFCSRDCYDAGKAAERTERAEREAREGRTCTACGKTKPLQLFYFREKRGHYTSRCKKCLKARSKRNLGELKKHAPEVLKARNRERGARYRAKNRGAYNANAHRYRARKLRAEGSHTAKDVVRLWHRQRGECARCETRLGKRPSDTHVYHVDHVTPLSRGGSDLEKNLQLLCVSCNCSKNDRYRAEFTLHLRRQEDI